MTPDPTPSPTPKRKGITMIGPHVFSPEEVNEVRWADWTNAETIASLVATIDNLREIYHKAASNETAAMDDLAVAKDLLRRWVSPERDMSGDDQDRFGFHMHDDTETYLGRRVGGETKEDCDDPTCIEFGLRGHLHSVAEVAEEVMPDAVMAQVVKLGEVGLLHRPMSNIEGDEAACPMCLGGIFAVDPEPARPCGCWGLLPPICTTCAVRYENGHWGYSKWPCETWKALIADVP